jgi:hypothetical protein
LSRVEKFIGSISLGSLSATVSLTPEVSAWHSKAMEAFDENSRNRGGYGDRSDNPGRRQDIAKEPTTFATRMRRPIERKPRSEKMKHRSTH